MSAASETISNTSAETEGLQLPRTIVDPETTIFVGNVARDCEEADLQSVFEEDVEVEIPSVKSGRLFKQRYAFVKFPSKIDFDAIKTKYDKTVVKERGIYIRRAQTEEERDEKRKARASRPKKTSTQRSSDDAVETIDNSESGEIDPVTGEPSQSSRKPARSAIPAPPKRQERPRAPLESMERSTDTLYVNNVPYMATKEQVAEFFNTKPELVVLPLRRMRNVKTKQFFYSKRMNRGIAFVTFEDCSDIAQKVTEFQGKAFNDRELAVDVAALKPPREEEPSQENEQPEAASSESNTVEETTTV
ncbi:LANO_0G09758g1_1 [Lachancea nothofagi CBS 11611]|uniref:LANO_0G09758g1_1 n=1 Tax=Lachancea nothofagi CBS 11611 TaxID=1266666 RepID=A0A1G4KIP7_9SACH|nr:LANO_0G09758g1_1 [Lachancea nothofagi CBS 11611]